MSARLRFLAVACFALSASLVATCSDPNPPNGTPDLVGRYLMTTIDGKSLPAIVLSSVGPAPLRAWDSMWVVADTLWLRSDSTAQELGAFVMYRANAAGETASVEYDTTVVGGIFRVAGREPTVRTWASTDDPVTISNGRGQISRSIQFAPFTSNPRRSVTYRRLQ